MYRCIYLTLLAVACSQSTSNPPAPGAQSSTASAAGVAGEDSQAASTAARGPAWLGAYTSSPRGFRTNSYWIEGPEGVVLIDTQFLPSAGLEAVESAESQTGKKVVAAVVLHANPDKFNGTAALQARGIRVITSAQVLEHIPDVHALRHKWFYDRYKPDYPDRAAAPESFGATSTTMTIAGIDLTLHVLGPGCSEAHVVLEHRGHVFVGDLVAGVGHSWLELGLLDEWLERLAEISALEPVGVHPGRGSSGGRELLARQRAYLDKVIAYVGAENPRSDASDDDRAAAVEKVAQRLEREFPDYPFLRFVEIGLPAVWDRLAQKAS